MTAPLYRRVLGARFDVLPPLVRQLHDLDAPARWTGLADVERGPSLFARLLAAILRFPTTGPGQALTVTFTPDADGEIWHRAFGSRVFRSRQTGARRGAATANPAIVEQVGPARLLLVPSATAEGLTLTLVRVTMFGIPAPGFLLPVVATREYELEGHYRFEVEARVPLFGLLVRYKGLLDRQDGPLTSPATRP